MTSGGASPTRWGIAGAGKISSDFVNSIRSGLDGREHRVVAVAARRPRASPSFGHRRKLESAQEFAGKFDIPTALEGYEALARCQDVEVVYVGSIHPHHLKIAALMFEAGKHVLCEKPLAMNVGETREMIDGAKRNGVFLMEAMWTRFSPAFVKLRQLLDRKAVGEPRLVDVNLGRKIAAERISRMELGGGTLLDLGVYAVQAITFVYGLEQPSKVAAAGLLYEKEGTDRSVSATFTYDGGCRMGRFVTHGSLDLDCRAEVVGDEGKIVVWPPFHASERITVHDKADEVVEEFEFPVKGGGQAAAAAYNFTNSANLRFQAQHVRECLAEGLKESPVMPLRESLFVAQLLEECRRQVGVAYPQDS